MDTATATATANAKVQHVAKKSSDELLRKFADSGDKTRKKKDLLRVSKRRMMMRREGGQSQCESTAFAERRSLLPPAAVNQRSALLRQLGIGKAQLRARYIRNKSLLGTIEETWRRTLEGASRVFMEKHYHRHKRLINDIV